MMKRARDFFTPEQIDQLKASIQLAEKSTSGELRVHLENRCKGEVLDRAAFVFDELNMQKTIERNGVLIYLAVIDHKFAILGDGGINEKVSNDYWVEMKDQVQKYFLEHEFMDGLTYAIEHVGESLKNHFPIKRGDSNELQDDITDEISISEN